MQDHNSDRRERRRRWNDAGEVVIFLHHHSTKNSKARKETNKSEVIRAKSACGLKGRKERDACFEALTD